MSKNFWEHLIKGQKVEFDNTPFFMSNIYKLDQQFSTITSRIRNVMSPTLPNVILYKVNEQLAVRHS